MEFVMCTIHEQPKMFPLATEEGWIMGAGHLIQIQDYEFVALPIFSENQFLILERSSGCQAATIKTDLGRDCSLEDAVEFLGDVVIPEMFVLITTQKEVIDQQIAHWKEKGETQLGPKPPEADLDFEDLVKWAVERLEEEQIEGEEE